jgi:hypothetical protein
MFADIITKEHIFLDKRTKGQRTMNIGLILMGIGFAIAYIVFQLIPLFFYLSGFDKELRKEMTFNDWLFAPLIAICILIPIAGILPGLIFYGETDKWGQRFVLIGTYLIIIGGVIFLVTK